MFLAAPDAAASAAVRDGGFKYSRPGWAGEWLGEGDGSQRDTLVGHPPVNPAAPEMGTLTTPSRGGRPGAASPLRGWLLCHLNGPHKCLPCQYSPPALASPGFSAPSAQVLDLPESVFTHVMASLVAGGAAGIPTGKPSRPASQRQAAPGRPSPPRQGRREERRNDASPTSRDGHGHVLPREDHTMAKRGGPSLCPVCEAEGKWALEKLREAKVIP
jgi:hypothetical protein